MDWFQVALARPIIRKCDRLKGDRDDNKAVTCLKRACFILAR